VSWGGPGRVAAEQATVGVRGGAAPGTEVVPQGGRVAEAGPVRNGIDGLVGLFQELLGQQDALADQPALRGGPGVLYETPGEGPFGHAGPGGQLPHGEGLVQVGAQPLQQIPQGPVAGGGDGLHHVLGLAAVTVRRHHHAPRDAVGHPRALLLADQVEASVDAGRRAGAGDHRIVIDIQDVGIDLGLGIPAGQFGRMPPVSGAATAIQQARLAEDEGAAAHAQQPRATLDGRAQRIEQVLGEPESHAGAEALLADRGQRDQIRVGQAIQTEGGLDGEVQGPQRGWLSRHHGEVVARQPVVGPVHPEDLADGAELERQEAVDQHHSDVTQHGALPEKTALPKKTMVCGRDPPWSRVCQVFGRMTANGPITATDARSGWPDSNRRPPRPKRGALAKLRYSPYCRRV
jgi:hypothetical protein